MNNVSVKQAAVHHDAAMRALRAAVGAAETEGARMCVAVVDASGLLAGFVRMPGAFLVSSDLAMKKAYTAASLGVPPDEAEAILANEAPRVREGVILNGLCLIRGGLPLRHEGVLIGAIGVSGGTETQDILCAQAGAAAIDA